MSSETEEIDILTTRPSGLPRTAFLNTGVSAFLGQALRVGEVRSVRLSFEVGWTLADSGNIVLRFHVKTSLFDEESSTDTIPTDEHLLADLECEIACEYAIEGDPQILQSPELLRELVEQRGMPDAFPYIRELVASMSTRLGFKGVTLQSWNQYMLQPLPIPAG